MFGKIKIKLIDSKSDKSILIEAYPDDTILMIKKRIFLKKEGNLNYYPPFIYLSLLDEPKDNLNNYRKFLKYNYKKPELSKNDKTNLSDNKFKIKLEKYKDVKVDDIPKPKRKILYDNDVLVHYLDKVTDKITINIEILKNMIKKKTVYEEVHDYFPYLTDQAFKYEKGELKGADQANVELSMKKEYRNSVAQIKEQDTKIENVHLKEKNLPKVEKSNITNIILDIIVGVNDTINTDLLFNLFVPTYSVPFLKIKSGNQDSKYKIFEKKIEPSVIKNWITTGSKGLQMKIEIEPTRYSTAMIYPNARIKYTCYWNEDWGDVASMKNIKNSPPIKKLNELIERINGLSGINTSQKKLQQANEKTIILRSVNKDFTLPLETYDNYLKFALQKNSDLDVFLILDTHSEDIKKLQKKIDEIKVPVELQRELKKAMTPEQKNKVQNKIDSFITQKKKILEQKIQKKHASVQKEGVDLRYIRVSHYDPIRGSKGINIKITKGNTLESTKVEIQGSNNVDMIQHIQAVIRTYIKIMLDTPKVVEGKKIKIGNLDFDEGDKEIKEDKRKEKNLKIKQKPFLSLNQSKRYKILFSNAASDRSCQNNVKHGITKKPLIYSKEEYKKIKKGKNAPDGSRVVPYHPFENVDLLDESRPKDVPKKVYLVCVDKNFKHPGFKPGGRGKKDAAYRFCCYKTKQPIERTAVKKTVSSSYIVKSFTRLLGIGRLGQLPPEISAFFNSFGDGGEYLRLGAIMDTSNFIHAVLLCSDDKLGKEYKKTRNKVTYVKELRERLSDELSIEVFKSLNGGNLSIDFNGDIDEYKKVLKSYNISLSADMIWDLLSKKTGYNIFIFESDSEKEATPSSIPGLKCIVDPNMFSSRMLKKPTIFLLYHSNFYEAIVFSKDGIPKVRYFLYEKSENNVVYLAKKLHDLKCNSKPVDDDPLENIPTASLVIKKLKDKNPVVGQIIQRVINRVIAVVAKDGTIIPTSPSAPEEIKTISMEDSLISAEKEFKGLKKIAKNTGLMVEPVAQILNDDGNVVAFYLGNNSGVPTKPSKKVSDLVVSEDLINLPEIDKFLELGSKGIKKNPQMNYVNRYTYITELYQRLRYNLSDFLDNNKMEKEKLKSIIQRDYSQLVLTEKVAESVLGKAFKNPIGPGNVQINSLQHAKLIESGVIIDDDRFKYFYDPFDKDFYLKEDSKIYKKYIKEGIIIKAIKTKKDVPRTYTKEFKNKMLETFLLDVLKNIVTKKDSYKDSKYPFFYALPQNRVACREYTSDSCGTDLFCKSDLSPKKCKLAIPKNIYDYLVSKLMIELLRNGPLASEIINKTIKTVHGEIKPVTTKGIIYLPTRSDALDWLFKDKGIKVAKRQSMFVPFTSDNEELEEKVKDTEYMKTYRISKWIAQNMIDDKYNMLRAIYNGMEYIRTGKIPSKFGPNQEKTVKKWWVSLYKHMCVAKNENLPKLSEYIKEYSAIHENNKTSYCSSQKQSAGHIMGVPELYAIADMLEVTINVYDSENIKKPKHIFGLGKNVNLLFVSKGHYNVLYPG